VLDAEALELRDPNDQLVEVAPSAFDLILCLIRNRSRVVLKEELFQELWPGVFVNENALAQCVWAARRAVGDGGREQNVIKNVRGRGYRFVAEVTESASTRGSGVVSKESLVAPERTTERAFVGRTDELKWLGAALAEAGAGRGRICLLAGEGGIGKTRLAEEIAAEAASRGFLVLEGRGYDDEGMPPFWPWKQILWALDNLLGQEAVREFAGAEAEDLAKLVPDLERRLERRPGASGGDADDDRYYLFQALTEFLVRASVRQPLWITLDDFHWADTSSARALEFMARALGRARIGMLVTFRGDELDAVRAKAIARVQRQACTERRELGGLSSQSVGQLLERAGLPAASDVVERISSVTAGNPLFVTQLAPLLVDRGVVEDPEGIVTLSLPSVIREALSRRIEGLEVGTQAVLGVAAVLGQTFKLSDLRRASGLETNAVLEVLDELRERNILREASDQQGLYEFVHPLIREIVYRGIGEAERAVLQRTVALAIEQSCEKWPAARLDELAHHYSEAAKAGVAEKAMHYTRLAAVKAFESLAFEESTRYYRRALAALDLCDAPDERERCGLLLGLGHALRGVGVDSTAIRGVFQDVADRARALNDADLFADAALAFAGGGPLRRGSLTEMGVVDATEVSLLGSAADALGEKDSEKKALVLSWLARSLYHSSETQRRTRAADDAVDMARRMKSDPLLGSTLFLRQQVLRTPHVLDRRIEDLTEIIGIAGRTSARELELDARYERAWAYTQAARIADAEADIQTVEHIANELRQPRYRRPLEMWNLVHSYVRENVDEAAARDLERLPPHRNERTNQAFGLRLMMARFLQDRATETIPLSELYTQQFPLAESWHSGLCSTYGGVGRMADCRRLFEERAVTGFAGMPMTHDWLSCHMLLANACRMLRDTERAPILRDLLVPFESQVWIMGIGGFICGAVASFIGELHTLLRDYRAAERSFEQSIDLANRLRSPGLAAYGKMGLAFMLSERRTGNDLAIARGLIAESRPDIVRTGFASTGRRADEIERTL
jgi:DNA-binding winged helix-turn-helix (wHTH) protein